MRRITGVLATLLIGPSALVVAAVSPATAAVPAASPGARADVLTLITGDIVTLSKAGDRTAATVRPAPGRERITFHTVEADGGLRILPSDVVPLISTGQVDADLFDVESLVADGYGDATSTTLPLIVTSPGGMRAKSSRALNGLGATAVRVDKSTLADFWNNNGTSMRTAGTNRIWLDGKMKASLDRSAAQIGAPAAWSAGFDGRGVKVGVLDTGIDANHPDIAGKITASANFSSSPDVVDRFGHGTHVAATVAGTGAGSAGRRKGIAYGSELLIGKVLGDDGQGFESEVIAGMQWAADAGAKVINMSLGAGPTDGIDPVSEALDRISDTTGALFVVAAGNDGGTSTVSSPSTAAAALSVGAVDRDERMAYFSSRGPRLGDLGLKPEITAPGVGIVAARAEESIIGDPVDALYSSMSGTSMATPHVAGAAAILAGEHPGWTGAQIKEALISTARTGPDGNVYAQGAGRVDVARATGQTVRGTGIADFGLHRAGETPTEVTRTVTYRNDGPAPVTLTIARPAELDGPSTVTVPAHGTQGTSFRLSLATLKPGTHSGWIVATGPAGERVTTAFGTIFDPPKHTVTLRAIDRDGRPTGVPWFTMFGDDARSDLIDVLGSDSRSFEVGEGEYLLHALIEDNNTQFEQASLVVIPELKVTRDIEVVLDARAATPIRIETPQPAEQQSVLSYYVHRVTGNGRQIAHGIMHYSNVQQVNVTPTERVKKGSFEFSSRWQLVRPDVQAAVPGVAGRLQINLRGTSPVFDGAKRFPLVTWGAADVRGKAVLIPSSLDVSEEDLIERAHEAGAAVAILIRPADWSHYSVHEPLGDRLPLPTLLAAHETGERLLARAARPNATVQLTLSVSSPYLYDVIQVSKNRVPEKIVHRVTPANSQRIVTDYPHNGGFDWVHEQRFGWRPWQDYAWNDTARAVRTPSTRVEWVSAGDSLWQHVVHPAYPGVWGSLVDGFVDESHSVQPGRVKETWAAPVVRPAEVAGYPSTRAGDVLKLRIADMVDSSDAHGNLDVGTSAELTRDGEMLATMTNGWQDVLTTPGDARYGLTVRTAPGNDEWLYGTSTTSTWKFRSASGDARLPLLQIGYDVAPRKVAFGLTVAGRPARGTTLTAEMSDDDGRTWRLLKASGSGPAWTAPIPAGKGLVSLRTTATDRDGNSVTQTVIRAFGRR